MLSDNDLNILTSEITGKAFDNDFNKKWKRNTDGISFYVTDYNDPDLSAYKPSPVIHRPSTPKPGTPKPASPQTPQDTDATSNRSTILWGTAGIAGCLGVALFIYMNWFKGNDKQEIDDN